MKGVRPGLVVVDEGMQRAADGFRALGETAERAAEQMQPKRPLPMNRADRRRAEREERRAAKLATIQAISRGLR